MTRPPGPPAQPAHPFSPAGRVDPYPAYDWLRAHEPVHRDPMTGMWLVTGYADCVALLKDPAFSAAAGQRERSRDDDLPVSMLTRTAPTTRGCAPPVRCCWARAPWRPLPTASPPTPTRCWTGPPGTGCSPTPWRNSACRSPPPYWPG